MTISQHTEQYKIITCFLPAGKGQNVLERLHVEMNIYGAFAYHARGAGLSNRRNKKLPEYVEREMISAVVPAERADEIFRFIFFASGIDQPHAGMVLMTTPQCATTLILPSEISAKD